MPNPMCCWRCGRWGVRGFNPSYRSERVGAWECANDAACTRRRLEADRTEGSPEDHDPARSAAPPDELEWAVVADGYLIQCKGEGHARAAAAQSGGEAVSRVIPRWVRHSTGEPLVDEPRLSYEGHPVARVIDGITESDVQHPEWEWGWAAVVDADPTPVWVRAVATEDDARAAVAVDPEGRVLCRRGSRGWLEA